jgi:hypothetical protein
MEWIKLQYVSQIRQLDESYTLHLRSVCREKHDLPSFTLTRPTDEEEIANRLTGKLVYDGSDHRIEDSFLLQP